jgi:Flp pilus assembly pilin Flp
MEDPNMKELSKIRKGSEMGAGLIEYTILVSLVTVMSLAAVRVFGLKVSQQFIEASGDVGGADLD